MYECLYGFTPFACDDRHQTKLKILQHRKTLVFPQPEEIPEPSIEALDLMMSILVEKEKRLCSRQYELNDFGRKIHNGRVVRCVADKTHHNYQGFFVYPGDAEDIKRHAFFREIDWDTMHLRRPPYLPRVKDWEDTKYFQEEEPISDIDSATTIDESNAAAEPENGLQPSKSKATHVSQHQQEGQHIVPSVSMKFPQQDCPMPDVNLPEASLKTPLVEPRVNGCPTTGATLVETGVHVEETPEHLPAEDVKPKAKKRDKKRPRDIILRDPVAGPPALETRKSGAFLGYEYRQPVMARDIVEQVLAEDLAKSKLKNHWQNDGQDLDMTPGRRVFVDAGGQLSSFRRLPMTIEHHSFEL